MLTVLHRSGIIHTNITPANVALINDEMLECVDYSKGRFVKRVSLKFYCRIAVADERTKYILKYPLIKITDYDESFVVGIGPGHHFIGSNGYRAPEVVLGKVCGPLTAHVLHICLQVLVGLLGSMCSPLGVSLLSFILANPFFVRPRQNLGSYCNFVTSLGDSPLLS